MEMTPFFGSYSTAHVKGKRYTRVSRGLNACSPWATRVFPVGYTRGTRRLTTRLTRVTILEPAGYMCATHNMQRACGNQQACGKSTPMQPTEVLVL